MSRPNHEGKAPGHHVVQVLAVEDGAFLRSSLAASLKGQAREVALLIDGPDAIHEFPRAGGVNVLFSSDRYYDRSSLSEIYRSICDDRTNITIVITSSPRIAKSNTNVKDAEATTSDGRGGERFESQFPAGKIRR